MTRPATVPATTPLCARCDYPAGCYWFPGGPNGWWLCRLCATLWVPPASATGRTYEEWKASDINPKE